MDPHDGTIYHIRFNPPPAEAASRVVQREDDNEATVRNRLSAYHEQTAPLAEWYQDRGILVRIDGDRTIEEVEDAIGNAIASMGSRDV